jgi:hypothetical protein
MRKSPDFLEVHLEVFRSEITQHQDFLKTSDGGGGVHVAQVV